MPKSKDSGKRDDKQRRVKQHWKDEPEDHDYPSAESYLSLLMAPTQVTAVGKALRTGRLVTYKAKDLLRASALPLLPLDNTHVAGDLKKVRDREKLSPVLLVRGSAEEHRTLIVADGYHRICASWYLDENADIPCRIADLPAARPAPAPRTVAKKA